MRRMPSAPRPHAHRPPDAAGDEASGANGVTAVVLAGGTSRRFGSDKLAADLDGSTVLDHLLDRLPAEWAVVCVGAERATTRAVRWVREDPPGGGPLSGIAAAVDDLLRRRGASRVDAGSVEHDDPIVVVLAGDMPHAASAATELVAEVRRPPRIPAAVARDETGHANPLLTAYRLHDLAAHLPRPAHDRPAKTLLALPHRDVPVSGAAGRDVDTPEDLERLRWRP